MRYGIYADIHGNLDAAEVALEFLKTQDLDTLICVGDIVGYGAWPNQCIELVKESGSIIVAGNHDWASVDLVDINYFNPYARSAIIWTKKELSRENKDFLKNLELEFRDDNITAVHGSLDKPSEFRYIFSLHEVRATFKELATKLCFIAHTHVPMLFRGNEGLDDISIIEDVRGRSLDMKLGQGYKYIVNVGSIGQPRDQDPRVCFVIYDSKNRSLTFKRLDYPIAKAQKKIIDAGLPQILSERLEQGY